MLKCYQAGILQIDEEMSMEKLKVHKPSPAPLCHSRTGGVTVIVIRQIPVLVSYWLFFPAANHYQHTQGQQAHCGWLRNLGVNHVVQLIVLLITTPSSD